MDLAPGPSPSKPVTHRVKLNREHNWDRVRKTQRFALFKLPPQTAGGAAKAVARAHGARVAQDAGRAQDQRGSAVVGPARVGQRRPAQRRVSPEAARRGGASRRRRGWALVGRPAGLSATDVQGANFGRARAGILARPHVPGTWPVRLLTASVSSRLLCARTRAAGHCARGTSGWPRFGAWAWASGPVSPRLFCPCPPSKRRSSAGRRRPLQKYAKQHISASSCPCAAALSGHYRRAGRSSGGVPSARNSQHY